MGQTEVFEVPAGTPDEPSVEEVDAGVPPEWEAYEVVDGRVLVKVGTTDAHDHVVVELGGELWLWARAHAAVVRHQTFDVRTTRTRRRQPDLLVVLAEHRARVGAAGMIGPPDLVVEVLSASTRAADLGEKRAEYAAIGVAEYWCIDPDAGEALVAAPPLAQWRMVRRGEVLASAALQGFSIPLERVLPPAAP